MTNFVLITFFILILSLDGILALFNMRQKFLRVRSVTSKQYILSNINSLVLDEEVQLLKQRKEGLQFPRAVLVRKGFTGRGSPLLTRYKYSNLNKVDAEIERIIQK